MKRVTIEISEAVSEALKIDTVEEFGRPIPTVYMPTPLMPAAPRVPSATTEVVFDPPVSEARTEFLRLLGELEAQYEIAHDDHTLVHLRIAAHSWAGDEFRVADDERRVLAARLGDIGDKVQDVSVSVASLEADIAEVLDSLYSTISCAPRDWAVDPNDAWIAGIICGWGEALADVVAAHHWDVRHADRLARLHRIVAGILVPRVGRQIAEQVLGVDHRAALQAALETFQRELVEHCTDSTAAEAFAIRAHSTALLNVKPSPGDEGRQPMRFGGE